MGAAGKFVWYELQTRDPEAAKAFYTHALGWGAQTAEEPTPYTMFTVQGQPVGGLMQLPAEAGGAPPSWLGYVGVENIEASTTRVSALGGRVHHDVTPIPGMGKFSVVADPQGAVFALYQSASPEEPSSLSPRTPGLFSWAELNTTDWESAFKFYSALFGWEHSGSTELRDGMGTYFMFKAPGEAQKAPSMGGMSNLASFMKVPAHWLFYVNVEAIGPALERIREKGGEVCNGPMEIPGPAQIAQCDDPQGAPFAVYAE